MNRLAGAPPDSLNPLNAGVHRSVPASVTPVAIKAWTVGGQASRAAPSRQVPILLAICTRRSKITLSSFRRVRRQFVRDLAECKGVVDYEPSVSTATRASGRVPAVMSVAAISVQGTSEEIPIERSMTKSGPPHGCRMRVSTPQPARYELLRRTLTAWPRRQIEARSGHW